MNELGRFVNDEPAVMIDEPRQQHDLADVGDADPESPMRLGRNEFLGTFAGRIEAGKNLQQLRVDPFGARSGFHAA